MKMFGYEFIKQFRCMIDELHICDYNSTLREVGSIVGEHMNIIEVEDSDLKHEIKEILEEHDLCTSDKLLDDLVTVIKQLDYNGGEE
jgi:hypothetical protein